MNFLELKSRLDEALRGMSGDRDKQRLVYQFGELVEAVESVATSAKTPQRVAAKAAAFLNVLNDKAGEHADTFWHPSWLLNFVGEAFVHANYISEPVVTFLSTGLYFHGITHIERREGARAPQMMMAHGELLGDYLSRKSLKELIQSAQERISSGRVFCLVHDYINTLKKRYWALCRKSEDACDRATYLAYEDNERADLPVDESSPAETSGEENRDVADRLQLMLRLFAEGLSEQQQLIYLSRHRVPALDRVRLTEAAERSEIEQLVMEIQGGSDSRPTWPDLGKALGMSEKAVKREYLRALHLLLRECSDRLLEGRRRSSMLDRVLNELRSVINERDLRMKGQTGRGMPHLVKRWEVALRFVLNHDRILTGSDLGFLPT